jgi:hypothetical protein
MECKYVEDLISGYIENELSQEVHNKITRHLEECSKCRYLKEKVEDLVYAFPELEEDVPFFLKNRLHYLPELQENMMEIETRWHYLKWIAASIGAFILFLNLFYFTNIYPPANRILHDVVSEIQTFAVKTEAIYERIKESKRKLFSSSQEVDSYTNGEEDEISMEKKIESKGGTNG